MSSESDKEGTGPLENALNKARAKAKGYAKGYSKALSDAKSNLKGNLKENLKEFKGGFRETARALGRNVPENEPHEIDEEYEGEILTESNLPQVMPYSKPKPTASARAKARTRDAEEAAKKALTKKEEPEEKSEFNLVEDEAQKMRLQVPDELQDGHIFNMSDQEYKGRKSAKQRLYEAKKKQKFKEKGESFMDGTALSKKPKHILDRWMNHGKEDPDDEYYTDLEEEILDLEEEARHEFEEFDYEGDPESVFVGYVKPGTENPHERKSLDDLVEERFDLKMDALSGLLNRFGAEGADGEKLKIKKDKTRAIDKKLFAEQMEAILRKLTTQLDEPKMNWLMPDRIVFLKHVNEEVTLLKLITAMIFARTPEPFFTKSDRHLLNAILEQIDLSFSHKQVDSFLQQLFIFPDRVFSLYEELTATTFNVHLETFSKYKQFLALYYLKFIAEKYQVSGEQLVNTIVARWNQIKKSLRQSLEKVQKENKQYQILVERGRTSQTLFSRLVQAEVESLTIFRELKELALEILKLRQVLLLITPEDALNQITTFELETTLGKDRYSKENQEKLPFEDLWTLIITKSLVTKDNLKEKVKNDTQEQKKMAGLTAVNQKTIINNAKKGEFKPLMETFTYKNSKISQILNLVSNAKSLT